MNSKPQKRHKRRKVLVIVMLMAGLIIGLIFLGVIPIGYKHVTIPEDIAYNGTLESKRGPQPTCPPASAPVIKLNYHVPAERDAYNAPVYSSRCPSFSRTYLLYW